APAGAVDVFALVRQSAGDVGVRVPVVVIDLHEPHAALDQPAGEQYRLRERTGLLRLVAIEFVGRGRLAAEVGQLRHGRMHPVGEFVLFDPRVRLGVADLPGGHLVESLETVQCLATNFGGHAGRVVDVEDRVAAGTQSDARVFAGKEPGRP